VAKTTRKGQHVPLGVVEDQTTETPQIVTLQKQKKTRIEVATLKRIWRRCTKSKEKISGFRGQLTF